MQSLNKGGLRMKVLYHYTSKVHLPKIFYSGYLKLTESNLRTTEEMYKPVVWLTTDKEPNAQNLGLNGSMVDKTEVRIHVKKKPTSTVKKWGQYSKKNKINKEWQKIFEEGRTPNTWLVSTKEIPLEDILLIENRYTNEVYYKDGYINTEAINEITGGLFA